MPRIVRTAARFCERSVLVHEKSTCSRVLVPAPEWSVPVPRRNKAGRTPHWILRIQERSERRRSIEVQNNDLKSYYHDAVELLRAAVPKMVRTSGRTVTAIDALGNDQHWRILWWTNITGAIAHDELNVCSAQYFVDLIERIASEAI
jgi:hypothetical protein